MTLQEKLLQYIKENGYFDGDWHKVGIKTHEYANKLINNLLKAKAIRRTKQQPKYVATKGK